MKKKHKHLLLVLLLGLTFAMQSKASVSILPFDQVKAGMKGTGLSVFGEKGIDEFEVEVIGVMHNYQPKRNMILARLSGCNLEQTGIVQGMSGSPIYIDGKLIGALAFSLATFTKDPIAGITPIEEMMAISERETPKSSFSPRISIKKQLSMEELYDLNKDFFERNTVSTFKQGILKPLGIPLVFNGFSSNAFEKAKPFFSKMGFFPVCAGQVDPPSKKSSFIGATLKPGDAVAAQLISGDLDMSAVGTVTAVDGSKVLAWGHPWYNLGPVDYSMNKAKVLTVINSLNTSFKLFTTGTQIGRISQDRNAGILGELGKKPRMIPLNINMTNENGDTKEFKIKVIDNKIFSPLLINTAVSGVLSSEERAAGDLSLNFEGDIHLENGNSIHLEDLFSGNFDSSIFELSNLVASAVYFLTSNEFRDLSIFRIDLKVYSSEKAKFSYLEKVWLDKYDVSPGERIQIKIYTRNFRGDSVVQDGGLSAPDLPSGSEFYIIVADSASLQQLERSQYRSQTFVPRSFNQLIRILGNLRKNNRIYIKVIASKPGLFLKGEEMPSLPSTMKTMFLSKRAAISPPTELSRSTLFQYQLPVPYVFQGAAIIPVRIK